MVTNKEIICYETDASRLKGKAERIIFPKSSDELISAIRIANLDIVPRGSGTSAMGGTIPNNSIIIDMNKMDKVLGFNRLNLIVHVEAGVSIKELNEKLNAVGFEFPINPLNDSSTIGGMVALNVSDSRSMKYGKMKDWVEEIEFVNGKAELIKTTKADLLDVCGMEGITGIIARVKLKVIPKIERSISIFQSDNLDEVLSIFRRLKSENDVVMLDFFPRSIADMLGLVDKHHLIIEFDSDRGKIKGENYKKIISLKDKVYYSLMERGYYQSQDPKFFLDKVKDFILFLEDIKVPYFAHLGSGIVHPFFKDSELEKQRRVIEVIKRMGGKPAEYGIGLKRKDFLDDFEKKIIGRVKSRYDPYGKLNKGKVIDFEGKINVGRHLQPLERHDIGKIKPFIDREKERILEFTKTPEEKIQELISEAELIEEQEEIYDEEGSSSYDYNEEIEKEEAEEPINKQLEVEEQVEEQVKEQSPLDIIEDYKQTFESELEGEKKFRVEEFAKNVAKQNLSRDVRRNVEQNLIQENKIEIEKKGKISKDEEDLIKKIMTGNFGFSKPKEEDKDEN